MLAVLAPLRWVRERKAVEILGLPSDKISSLADVMKSLESAVDLSSMWDQLQRYKDHMTYGDSYVYLGDEMERIAE